MQIDETAGTLAQGKHCMTLPPPIVTDSHCHLDFPDFDGELPDLIARAHAAGVHRMVTICTRAEK